MSTPSPTPARPERTGPVRLWLVPTPGPALDPEPVVRLLRPGVPSPRPVPRPWPTAGRGRSTAVRSPGGCCPTRPRSRTAW